MFVVKSEELICAKCANIGAWTSSRPEVTIQMIWILIATTEHGKIIPYGEVQEWLNWLVSKTSVPQGTEGSNPSLSAKKK